jgi:hypothetical protein
MRRVIVAIYEPRHYGHTAAGSLSLNQTNQPPGVSETSLGFDERTWLDHFGNPVGEDMTFEERYHRVDRDTLELNMVINSPKAYTKPWVSEKKTFRLAPPNTEIQELFCVPSEEQRFNQLVRDPGSGITKT